MLVRLQKYLADAGVASRRASEAIILAKRVTVNGETADELGTKVDPAQDRVTVDGTVVRPRRKLYVAVNKPVGFLCTRQDPHPGRLVAELLPREWREVYPVGRLDKESEGLLFLTNDGEFCLRLTHPRFGIRKTYLAVVRGRVERSILARLMAGVVHEGEHLRAQKARLLSASTTHSVVELELSEGRNREVRRLFESQGLLVERLQRTQIGRIKLGELPPGKWRVLTAPELESLRHLAAEVSPDRPTRTPSEQAPAPGAIPRRRASGHAGRRPRGH